MPDYCCVADCKKSRVKDDGISFYRVPFGTTSEEEADRRRLWVTALGLDKWSEERIDNARVCSRHFISGKKSMDVHNPDYVPSVFAHSTQTPKSGQESIGGGNNIRMSHLDPKAEDIKNMLMSFRIAELQTLLASCGRSRSGRKHELLGRAVALLKSSSHSSIREKVQAGILELYYQRYPQSVSSSSSSRGAVTPSTSMESLAQESCTSNYPSYQYREKPSEPQQPTYLNRPPASHYKPQQQPSLHKSKYPSHPSMSKQPHHQDSRVPPHHMGYPPPIHPQVPIHPDVRFIPLPFYDCIDELIKPTSLVQKTMSGYQEMSVMYHLTPYQTQLITNSRSFNIKSLVEYGVQVHLRLCLAETSCVQEDLYPSKLKVILGNKSIPIPGQPPPNAQNQEPRKPHRPINITPSNISPLVTNHLTVQWMPSDQGQRFTLTVHLVKTVHAETLIQQLRNKPERSAEHTKAFINEKLRPDPDSEIAMTSLKVSLCCPIGKTKMTYPCRANNCNHLQCFDGSTYIQMNERKPSWVCPVCDKKAHYAELFKDGLFTSIIKQSADCDEIMFFEDGSWRPLQEVQDSQKPMAQQFLPPTPKTPKNPPRLLECGTPPTLNVNTPQSAIIVATPVIQHSPAKTEEDVMPTLERVTPVDTAQSSSGAAEKDTNEEPEVEVISIDSDSDEEPPPANSNTTIQHQTNNETLHTRSVRYRSDEPPPSSLPPPPTSMHHYSDPGLQGMELYNLLPREDRMAAALYLGQAGYLENMNGGGRRVGSPSSIIDISDE